MSGGYWLTQTAAAVPGSRVQPQAWAPAATSGKPQWSSWFLALAWPRHGHMATEEVNQQMEK